MGQAGYYFKETDFINIENGVVTGREPRILIFNPDGRYFATVEECTIGLEQMRANARAIVDALNKS